MKIVIMRHGEASMGAPSDAERPLTAYGCQQAELAGECLAAQGFQPDLIWLSPYLRTRQTAEGVTRSLKPSPQQVQNFITPDNHPEDVLEQLQKLDIENLLLVSHQPLVSSLVSTLVEGNLFSGPSMAPASMVLIQADELLAGCCELVWQRHSPNFEVTY